MLDFMYGRTYLEAAKAFLLVEKELEDAQTNIANSITDASYVGHVRHAYHKEPCAAVAAELCKNVRQHLKMYMIAHRYNVAPIMAEAKSALEGQLARCWNSPEVLEVIKYLWATLPIDEEEFRDVILGEVAARLPMMQKSTPFRDFIKQSSELCMAILLKAGECPAVPPQHKRAFYCPECHRNRLYLSSDRSRPFRRQHSPDPSIDPRDQGLLPSTSGGIQLYQKHPYWFSKSRSHPGWSCNHGSYAEEHFMCIAREDLWPEGDAQNSGTCDDDEVATGYRSDSSRSSRSRSRSPF